MENLEEFKSKLPTNMPLETILEMVDKDMFVPDVRVILTNPEVRMLVDKDRSQVGHQEGQELNLDHEEGVRYVGSINPITGQAIGRAENAKPSARIPHGAEKDGYKEVAMSGNVRKAVEDLEIKMKVDKMEKTMKDRKVLVGRKRNVGKTAGKVQQTINQFLEKKTNGGKVLFGLGCEEGGRKRRLSGL